MNTDSDPRISINIDYYQSIISTATKPTTKNAALIHAYGYYRWGDRSLYDGPTNDAIDAANHLKAIGYEVHMYYMKSNEELLELIKNFVSSELDNFVFYNASHGGVTKLLDNEHDFDKDGTMESLSLGVQEHSKQYITPLYDYQIKDVIDQYNNSKQLWLMSDSCHSGQVFNISDTDTHIVDITAVSDDSTARQWQFKAYSWRGLFSKSLWEIFDKGEIDTTKIAESINDILAYKTANDKNPIQVCQNHIHSSHFLGCYAMKFNYTTIPSYVAVFQSVPPLVVEFKDNDGNTITDKDFMLEICGLHIHMSYAVTEIFDIYGQTVQLILLHNKLYLKHHDNTIYTEDCDMASKWNRTIDIYANRNGVSMTDGYRYKINIAFNPFTSFNIDAFAPRIELTQIPLGEWQDEYFHVSGETNTKYHEVSRTGSFIKPTADGTINVFSL